MSMKKLFSLDGKVALITGGSRGIGFMMAQGLVEYGAKVYIAARKTAEVEAAAAELSKVGTCIALTADLGTEAGCNALAAEIMEREEKLHILINNAGANWGAPLAEFPDAAWDKVLALNVKGVFHLTRTLVPHLEKAAAAGDPARVINIGSVDGLHVPGLETYAYSASKAGLHHMTRVLARRLARDHINVNAVAPGPFQSKMMAATIARAGDALKKSIPRQRIGEPSD
ncbi:MAG: SDR family NAD(P)-dependent oxidoreductase, partial [Deltaproteobacteria bacterium]